MVRTTSARPSAVRLPVPAKMTSSILPPRSALFPCSPSTQEIASTTLDLPEPLGPTTQVIPGSSFIVVADAKDLKPLTVRLLRCTELHRSVGYYRAGYRWDITHTGSATHHNPRVAVQSRQNAQANVPRSGQKAARRQPREVSARGCSFLLRLVGHSPTGLRPAGQPFRPLPAR